MLKAELKRMLAEAQDSANELKEENAGLQSQVKLLQYELSVCTSDEDKLKQQVIELEKKLKTPVPEEDPLEAVINSKHPHVNALYKARPSPYIQGENYGMDLREFVAFGLPEIHDAFFNSFSLLRDAKAKPNFDDKAQAVENWVRSNYTWTADSIKYKANEYWATVSEMRDQLIRTSVVDDDCDGGSVMLYNAAVWAGVPYYRLRLNIGPVRGGGHAYVSYLNNAGNWVLLDWCFEVDSTPVSQRVRHKDKIDYYGIWLSVNSKWCFAEAAYEDENISVELP